MTRRAGAAWLLVAVLGCDPSPVPPADAGADVPASDAGTDAGTDAGPPPSPFCRACSRDVECGPGALCLYLSGGERGCGVPCASDADCTGLGLPARCEEEAPGLGLQCRPDPLDCSPVDAGAPCSSDGDCRGRYDRCVDPEGLGGYCTSACESGATCPVGFRRCAEVETETVCVRDEASPAERCAAIVAAGLATECAADGSCSGGRTCHGSGPIRLCLAAPPAGGCPSGTVEMESPDGRRCVPHVAVPGAPLAELAPDCACVIEDGGLFLEAAELDGRSRCELRFEAARIEGFGPELAHDRFRLSSIDRMHMDWTALPPMGTEIGRRLDASSTSAAAILREAAILDDLSVPVPSSPATTDLVAALVALAGEAGGTVDATVLGDALATVPAPLAGALAGLTEATRLAAVARAAAVADYDSFSREELFAFPSGLFLGAIPGAAAPTEWRADAIRGGVDVGAMARAAVDVAAAVDALREAGPFADAGSVRVEIGTPIGRIAIVGTGDDDHATGDGPWLLLVDLGGDDTYRGSAGATASIDNGVSVLLDLGGTDDYGYDEVPVASDVGPPGHRRLPSDADGRVSPGASDGPRSRSRSARQGAGRLGIGLLFDLGIEGDRYRSLRMSQGYGALGIGMLFDEAGNDVYEGEAATQGAAVAGVGLLVDLAGDDEHVAYHDSQGFAFSLGVGVLYDASGTDVYFAHPSDVLYWSPQSPGASNSSFCQGAGFARRDDGGGTYMSGGIGVLRDASGDDRYTCGIFGQATGYWFGAGFLLDGDGSDHYDGEWYIQAGNAHFAMAALIDEGGSDFYGETAIRRNVALGGGHDFSVAWLLERGGDDTYRAPGLSYGVGHAGGFGAFVDLGGTDAYDSFSDFTYGHASIETPGDALRRLTGSIGIFVDRGATDTYVRPTLAPVTDEGSWTQALHTGENEHGAGIDRAIGEVGVGLD